MKEKSQDSMWQIIYTPVSCPHAQTLRGWEGNMMQGHINTHSSNSGSQTGIKMSNFVPKISCTLIARLVTKILADLENHALFKDDLECQKLILEAMKYHLLPERRTLMQSPRTKPRKSTVGTLYAVGGMDNNKGATTIEKYDLRTNIWIQAGVMNGRRLQFGVAVIDDKLFVIGGRDGLKTLNTVECYNPKTKTWTVLPPMSTHRHGLGPCGHCLAVVQIQSLKQVVICMLIQMNWQGHFCSSQIGNQKLCNSTAVCMNSTKCAICTNCINIRTDFLSAFKKCKLKPILEMKI
ncbi:Kelch-like protein 1 [Varanus komodoensis]|nr:Kelch-like protein 1 [Varanus komodoensis]